MADDYEKITAKDYDQRIVENSYEHYKKHYFNETVELSKLRRILSIINVKGKKLLDIGCSMGFFSFAYANSGEDVDAIDYSEESLKIPRLFLNLLYARIPWPGNDRTATQALHCLMIFPLIHTSHITPMRFRSGGEASSMVQPSRKPVDCSYKSFRLLFKS